MKKSLLFIPLFALGCAAQKNDVRACRKTIMAGLVAIPEDNLRFEKTIPSLLRYKEKMGSYPIALDSLTKLDSIDYSYLRTAWKIDYAQLDGGRSFQMNGKTGQEAIAYFRLIEKEKELISKMVRGEVCRVGNE